MSMVLKAYGTDVPDTVFICYDFKQVNDMIMIVAYLEEYKRWEKLLVYRMNDTWELETLQPYLDEKKFNWICSKLNLIFQNRFASSEMEIVDIDKEMQTESEFIHALNAV